jgi:phage gp37-like protein
MIAAVENAIIARLKAAAEAGVLGYAYRELDSLPVLLDEELVNAQFPSAFVVFAGAQGEQQTSRASIMRASFHVIVAAQNYRNEAATRHGAGAGEVGSYQMALDAAGLLFGEDLGLDIEGFQVAGLTPLYNWVADKGRRLSVLGLELRTRFPLPGSPQPEPSVGDFETFHVDWDMPPHGLADADPAPELPADDQADAVSHQTLETAP